ncbi:MAG: hypothetical protein WC054_02370 [Candidatus Nanopelagicales bacterium]
MATAVFATMRKLRDVVAAADGIADADPAVPVALGFPAGAMAKRDTYVWISGQVLEWEQKTPMTSGGIPPKDERFVIAVRLVVTRTGTDWLTPAAVAEKLVAAIEDAVRSDYFLGQRLEAPPYEEGTIQFAQVIRGDMEEGIPDDRKRQIAVSLDVEVKTWLA